MNRIDLRICRIRLYVYGSDCIAFLTHGGVGRKRRVRCVRIRLPDNERFTLRLDFHNMKLRIKGNNLRLRLTRSDIARLGEVGRIEDAINFTHNQSLVYELIAEPDVEPNTESLRASFSDNRITVTLPVSLARELVETTRVGISGEQEAGALSLLIEKDFACLDGDAGEDQADAFPNPNVKC